MAACHYHPDRSGIGVCMRCRVVICAGCCTRLDGVNHCHACLAKLGRRAALPRPDRSLGTLAMIGTLGLAWLFFFAFLWRLQGALAP